MDEDFRPCAAKAATKDESYCEEATWDECTVGKSSQQVIDAAEKDERGDVECARWGNKQRLYYKALHSRTARS